MTKIMKKPANMIGAGIAIGVAVGVAMDNVYYYMVTDEFKFFSRCLKGRF